MDMLIASVFFLAIAPEMSGEASPATSTHPTQTQTQTVSQPETTVGQTQITCPPGQFASAFSDVYPTDWAYEAVNRLASVPVQCFDLPTEEDASRD
ncbi:MAG: hypothetical protein AAFW84_12015 [Cyanobacteria bacterium J06635_15]